MSDARSIPVEAWLEATRAERARKPSESPTSAPSAPRRAGAGTGAGERVRVLGPNGGLGEVLDGEGYVRVRLDGGAVVEVHSSKLLPSDAAHGSELRRPAPLESCRLCTDGFRCSNPEEPCSCPAGRAEQARRDLEAREPARQETAFDRIRRERIARERGGGTR